MTKKVRRLEIDEVSHSDQRGVQPFARKDW
jgi:hypothetical protein